MNLIAYYGFNGSEPISPEVQKKSTVEKIVGIAAVGIYAYSQKEKA